MRKETSHNLRWSGWRAAIVSYEVLCVETVIMSPCFWEYITSHHSVDLYWQQFSSVPIDPGSRNYYCFTQKRFDSTPSLWHCKRMPMKGRNPETSFNHLILEARAPSLCLFVRPSVTPAFSVVRRANNQQETKFGPAYSVRLQLGATKI